MLRYYEGSAMPEIAQVLGCRFGTVRGYACRALAALRVTVTERERAFIGGDTAARAPVPTALAQASVGARRGPTAGERNDGSGEGRDA